MFEHTFKNIDDILSQDYVVSGFEQLDDSRLGALLVLKYHDLADAKAKLGDIPSFRDTFINFQQHLYG